MGTPDFAVPCLDSLVSHGYDIVGVITAVDKYGGRGKKTLIESAVKQYAVSKNLKVLQPKNLKSPAFLEELKALQADLQVVVAFRMLPVAVWDMPRLGTYNIHGSLLPKYRGAAPINWAIIRGESVTGVTSFKLKHEIDTGDMYAQETLPIYHTDTLAEVHDRMQMVGARLLLRTVDDISAGTIELQAQVDSEVSHAPKLFTETCQLDFSLSCKAVYDFIRGLNPYPVAWTSLAGQKLKIYRATYSIQDDDVPTGTLISDNKSMIQIRCADGYLSVQDLQLQGKKRMKVKDFLNGYSFTLNDHGQVVL